MVRPHDTQPCGTLPVESTRPLTTKSIPPPPPSFRAPHVILAKARIHKRTTAVIPCSPMSFRAERGISVPFATAQGDAGERSENAGDALPVDKPYVIPAEAGIHRSKGTHAPFPPPFLKGGTKRGFTKMPMKAHYPDGGVDWPAPSSPQHATEPSSRTPHVCDHPALTDVNSPDGGDDSPKRSEPEHATEPSVLTPHV